MSETGPGPEPNANDRVGEIARAIAAILVRIGRKALWLLIPAFWATVAACVLEGIGTPGEGVLQAVGFSLAGLTFGGNAVSFFVRLAQLLQIVPARMLAGLERMLMAAFELSGAGAGEVSRSPKAIARIGGSAALIAAVFGLGDVLSTYLDNEAVRDLYAAKIRLLEVGVLDREAQQGLLHDIEHRVELLETRSVAPPILEAKIEVDSPTIEVPTKVVTVKAPEVEIDFQKAYDVFRTALATRLALASGDQAEQSCLRRLLADLAIEDEGRSLWARMLGALGGREATSEARADRLRACQQEFDSVYQQVRTTPAGPMRPPPPAVTMGPPSAAQGTALDARKEVEVRSGVATDAVE